MGMIGPWGGPVGGPKRLKIHILINNSSSTCHFHVNFGIQTGNSVGHKSAKDYKRQVRGWGRIGGLNTEIFGQNHSRNQYFS